jgi:hypothetical protein
MGNHSWQKKGPPPERAGVEREKGESEIIERFEDRLADRISQTSRDETDRPAETTYGSPEMDER